MLAEFGAAGCLCVIGALGFGLVFAVHKMLVGTGGGGGGGLTIGNAPASGGNGAEAGNKPLAYDGKLLNPCNMVRMGDVGVCGGGIHTMWLRRFVCVGVAPSPPLNALRWVCYLLSLPPVSRPLFPTKKEPPHMRERESQVVN